MQTSRYRYPGTKPFERTDKDIFFGRKYDIEQFCKLIALEPVVVLYSKSGLGKSSLLNAGVIPYLEEKSTPENTKPNSITYRALRIRFFPYQENHNKPIVSPLEVTLNSLKALLKEQQEKQSEHQENSLLMKYLLQKDFLRIWDLLRLLQLSSEERVLMVFDQFEELFTYPEEHIAGFKKQLAEALYSQIPKDIQPFIEDIYDEMKDQELILLEKIIPCRVVFAIRQDRISFLDKLSDYLPQVLRIWYELKPLNTEQAREAIISPAQAKNEEFITDTFEYDSGLLEHILSELSAHKRKSIETFQLQLVCRYAEKQIEKNKQNGLASRTLTQNDIGNIKAIFETYYLDLLKELSKKERKQTRYLIEEKLIVGNVRVPLPLEVLNQEFKIPKPLLDKLVGSYFILRAEQNNVGGTSYELSHDTLIEPVQNSYQKRKNEQKTKIQIGIFALAMCVILGVSLFLSWKNKSLADSLEEKDIKLQKENIRFESIISSLFSKDMVFIEGGYSEMGCTEEQTEFCKESEKGPNGKAIEVILSDFYISKYEVTQEQWEAVMGYNPSNNKRGGKYPVESISWDSVQIFIERLNRITNKEFRLPTEAEWEYAARGGQKREGFVYAGSNDPSEVGVYYQPENGLKSTEQVGSKRPNALELYDMSGNVMEWCQDWFDANFYQKFKAQQDNPMNDKPQEYFVDGKMQPLRVLRGGSWNNEKDRMRVSRRASYVPSKSNHSIGLRLVVSATHLRQIKGLVKGQDGRPIQEAKIIVHSDTVKTDEQGIFEIMLPFNLQQSQQLITVQKEGYHNYQRREPIFEGNEILVILKKK